MGFIYSQLIQSLPYPSTPCAGKTVIVTGSNVGLGKEAARHFARLGAKNLILAVRSMEKGNAAKEDIVRSTGVPESVVQVWKLDMADYSSVKAFTKKAKAELERVDIMIANAGIATDKFVKQEEDESTVTVNVVSTFLLALLMLPQMKETASKFDTKPTLTITSSEVHAWTNFKEKSAPEGQIFQVLSDEGKADMSERYQLSKLLEVLAARAFTERNPASTLPVTVNFVNPGLCHSELGRDAGWFLFFLKLALARSTEYGSRTLVHAATQGSVTHGQYMSDCKITPPSDLVLSQEGNVAQERVWAELVEKLEKIEPGVTKV